MPERFFQTYTEVSRRCQRFGIVDRKGRECQAIVTRVHAKVVDARDEHFRRGAWRTAADDYKAGDVVVLVGIQAARDGNPFGASSPRFAAGTTIDASTERNAAQYEAKRLRKMKSRYQRLAQKGRL